jgi:hypothetical protein
MIVKIHFDENAVESRNGRHDKPLKKLTPRFERHAKAGG